MNNRALASGFDVPPSVGSGSAGGELPDFGQEGLTSFSASALDLAVDVGTSPHGLSVDLQVPDPETLDALSNHPPAKPLLTSPAIYRNAELLESCRIIEEAAAKRSSGFFGLTLTQEQCSHLAFAVLEQVESLEESHEADEPEVQEAIRCLREVRGLLKRAAKEHAVKTGNAKGGSTWRKDSGQLFDKEVEL